VNCPKCGFAQEDRVDCKKCGVVFAKYLAFHAQDPTVPSEIPESLRNPTAIYEEPQNPESSDLGEIRQSLRDLQQRFKELEYERAERRHIRSEIRELEDKLQQGFIRIGERQETIEQHLSKIAGLPPTPTAEDLAALKTELHAMDFASVQHRIEQIENSLQSHSEQPAGRQESFSVELLHNIDARLQDAEFRLAGIVDDRGETPTNGGQAQLTAALNELGQLKTTLNSVSVRYSEIGELKKNHLVLQNRIDSLQQSVENSKAAAREGSTGKIPELEKEVLALGAENRKIFERVESLESQALPTATRSEIVPQAELSSLKEDVTAFSKLSMEEMCRMQAELSALGARMKEGLPVHEKLPERLASLATEIHSLDQQYRPLCENMERLNRHASGTAQNVADLSDDLATLRGGLQQAQSQIQFLQERVDGFTTTAAAKASPPTVADIHLIRENLDEIRGFMAKMSRKI
jgi:chromosome segregation ATPase